MDLSTPISRYSCFDRIVTADDTNLTSRSPTLMESSSRTPRTSERSDDATFERNDEELSEIDRNSSSTKTHVFQTPEHSVQKKATRSDTHAINDPPPLLPRYPSFTHSYQPWNVPTEEEQQELSWRLSKIKDAPQFPNSPMLMSQVETTGHSTDCNCTSCGLVSTSSTSVNRNGCVQDHGSSFYKTDTSSVQRRTRSTSLSGALLLTFQDCHFVRLPPRVSRSDGYLLDAKWRFHNEISSSSNNNTTLTSPDRKKSKTGRNPFASDNDEPMPLLTPVEGYTIATSPAVNYFTKKLPDICIKKKKQPTDEERLTFVKDKNSYDKYNDDVVYTSSIAKHHHHRRNNSNDSDESSREATPLPLLDFDDDDDDDDTESRTSSNEDSCNNEQRSSSSSSGSPSCTTDEGRKSSRMTDASATTPGVSSTTRTSSSLSSSSELSLSDVTSITSRPLPFKVPKLKMRTNHPLLVNNPRFHTSSSLSSSSIVLRQQQHQQEQQQDEEHLSTTVSTFDTMTM